ncbi:hypothetical protein LP52_01195 [Streptomonospora alba]|uniref:Transposase (putative) YhgA-like domain-containing protein n=2 Tax=Streptomonospora alba TaxID=183763 RepID=A0A0C2JU61_9ACTN|nr:hypothetical protein LP52_01195 [Streptomonospora alba]
MEIPAYDRAETGCADLTSFSLKETKADQVSVLFGADGRRLMAIISEVQAKPDDEKAYTWPLYTSIVRERLRCPVHLLALCPDRRTAEWARKPIGERSGSLAFQASGLGPDNMPVIADPARAQQLPELSVLSTVLHVNHAENPAVLDAVQAALDVLPEKRREDYYDYIWWKLNEPARQLWETMMQAEKYEWQGTYRRKIEENEARGFARGVARGVAQGIAQGIAQGVAEAKAEDILRLLDSHGVDLSDGQRETIKTCTDIDRLDTWFDRALKATTARDVFTP